MGPSSPVRIGANCRVNAFGQVPLAQGTSPQRPVLLPPGASLGGKSISSHSVVQTGTTLFPGVSLRTSARKRAAISSPVNFVAGGGPFKIAGPPDRKLTPPHEG